jgi:hypothetical protein
MGFLSKDQLAGMMSAIKKYISDVINSAQSNGIAYSDKRIYNEVSYEELLTLVNESSLKPGAKYLIKDYVTTTIQENTLSDGNTYYKGGRDLGLLVTAISDKALSDDAKYFTYNTPIYDTSYASWDVKYCLYNDIERFAWADNIKHNYIKFIKDVDKNNVKFYDNQGNEIDHPSHTAEELNSDSTKKNSRYLQDNIYIEDGVHDGNYYFINSAGGFKLYVDEYTYNQLIDNKKFSAESVTTFLAKDSRETYFAQVDTIDFMTVDSYCNGKGVIYYMKDENGNEAPYDFKHIKFKHPNDTVTYPNYYYTFTYLSSDSDNSISEKCYNNVIKEYYNFGKLQLNNIVFINDYNIDSDCYNNTFGTNCYNNSFGDDCHNNSFGDDCYNNSFGNSCICNSFGDYCTNNIFGNSCISNVFGNDFKNNSFGEGGIGNVFGNLCESNSFGEYFTHNSFANICKNNTFGDNCNNNSFGIYCIQNSFGEGCNNNSFGNECGYNALGNYCDNNSFGNNCVFNYFKLSANTIEKNLDFCCVNHFDEGSAYNVIWNSTQPTNLNKLKNLNIIRGVSNEDVYNYINITKLNAEHEIKVAKNSAGEIKVYCEADLIE